MKLTLDVKELGDGRIKILDVVYVTEGYSKNLTTREKLARIKLEKYILETSKGQEAFVTHGLLQEIDVLSGR